VGAQGVALGGLGAAPSGRLPQGRCVRGWLISVVNGAIFISENKMWMGPSGASSRFLTI